MCIHRKVSGLKQQHTRHCNRCKLTYFRAYFDQENILPVKKIPGKRLHLNRITITGGNASFIGAKFPLSLEAISECKFTCIKYYEIYYVRNIYIHIYVYIYSFIELVYKIKQAIEYSESITIDKHFRLGTKSFYFFLFLFYKQIL